LNHLLINRSIFSKYLIVCILAIASQAIQHLNYSNVFLNSYFDDIVIIPLCMGAALILQRKFITKNNDFVFSNYITIFVIFYFFVVFEGVIPLFNQSFTSDIYDGLAYVTGALIFQLWMNKPNG
jgi:hypothetical protein